MTTTLHITEKAINSRHILGLQTHRQEFGSHHRDSLHCCQTHAFLLASTLFARQLIVTQKPKITQINAHITTKGFDQI